MKALVIVARGLQMGVLGCYGNSWVETPSLDALAAEGVVFDQHFADAADPAGARRAWRSGRYYLPNSGSAPDGNDLPDLLAALRTWGIHTVLVVDDSHSTPGEFEAGWDEVEHIPPPEEGSALETVLEAAGAALERLEQRDDWLLWLDLATSLPPWHVPEEFQTPYFTEEEVEGDTEGDKEEAEPEEPLTPLTEITPGPIDPDDDPLYLSLQSSYASAVTYLDAGIGSLLEALVNLRNGEEVLVVLTTDCGQNLGEHGIIGPVRPWLHDEVIHLPLLLRLPGPPLYPPPKLGGDKGGGRRVAALTQAVDLVPTLAAWFGAPLPGAHGHSLLSLARGQTDVVRPYACAGLQIGEAVEWALRTPEWALLIPGQAAADTPVRGPQLYVKPDDRWEVNDVRQHHLDLAERLEQTLRDFVTAACQPGPLQAPPLPDREAVATGPDQSPEREASAPPLGE